MLAQAVHTPALLGKMPKERGQEHMVPMSTKEGWQVWQTVGLVQVAQVEGQERQSGEERYFPGRHSRHEVMVPAEIVQLTHPTDRDPQEVQADPQTQEPFAMSIPTGQERQPEASQVEQGEGQLTT